MNGRVYDPVIGRFLSADPIVQAPASTQSHNCYTYVLNNPLSFTNPSGFGWLRKFVRAVTGVFRAVGRIARKVVRAFVTSPIGPVVGHILFAPIGPPGVGAALFSAISTAVTGGDLGDVLSAAAISSGLLGASMGEFAAPLIRGMPGGVPAQTIAASMVGGGAAELGGGKFQDGATSAAFVYLYNEAGADSASWSEQRLAEAGKDALTVVEVGATVATLPFVTVRATFYGAKGLASLLRWAPGIRFNNGWRTADGRFASPQGPGAPGAAAEESVWNAVAAKPGWQVIEGRVSVRNAAGDLRVYDGIAISPRGRAIGLELSLIHI